MKSMKHEQYMMTSPHCEQRRERSVSFGFWGGVMRKDYCRAWMSDPYAILMVAHEGDLKPPG